MKISDLQLRDFAYQSFNLLVDRDTDRADILKAEFWTIYAGSFSAGSEIRVIAEDNTWVMRLIVTHVDGTDIRVIQESFTELVKCKKSKPVVEIDGYEVKMRGKKKWCVIKQSDGTVVKDMIATKDEAIDALTEHVAKLEE